MMGGHCWRLFPTISWNDTAMLWSAGRLRASFHLSQHQTRETLTPYLTAELEFLKEAGFDCTGVTSPWVFGIDVQDEYVASIVAAQKAVYGRNVSWYFLHMLWDKPETKPWIAFQ